MDTLAYFVGLDRYISFIGIRTLFDQITRGYGDHSPLTRPKEEVTHGGRCRRGRGCRRLGGGGECCTRAYAPERERETYGDLRASEQIGATSQKQKMDGCSLHGEAARVALTPA